jgi:hypothetical protein
VEACSLVMRSRVDATRRRLYSRVAPLKLCGSGEKDRGERLCNTASLEVREIGTKEPRALLVGFILPSGYGSIATILRPGSYGWQTYDETTPALL